MSADNWTTCPQCEGDEFREDYEVGVFGTEFFVDYRGACKGCRFSYRFKDERDVLPLPTKAGA